MFDQVSQKAHTAINICSICEHHHPTGCNFCDLNDSPPNPTIADPWWPAEEVKVVRINVASGEDVCHM